LWRCRAVQKVPGNGLFALLNFARAYTAKLATLFSKANSLFWGLSGVVRGSTSGRETPPRGIQRAVRSWLVRTKTGKRDKWLTLIGVLKVIKAVLLLALAIGAIRLIFGDAAENLENWVRRLNVDIKNPVLQAFPAKIDSMTPRKLSVVSIGAFVYAALFLTEGLGLLLQKRWAEYFTLIITASFLPFEIYELVAKGFSAFKLVLLLANVAVVIYLIWRLKHERKSR
jgi:uncharacterized membrane protein (DUF2068 family)